MRDTGPKTADITIRNLTRYRVTPRRRIRRIVTTLLRTEGAKGASLCVTYVSDAYIKRLNLKYKKINKATDVLAFSALEGRSIKGIGSFLGDIIISVDTAKRQANIFNSTKTKELELYLVHGILHLLGYRDDTKKNFECMTRTQEGLLRKI